MYVVVNTDQPASPSRDWYWVMPGEDPHTYPTLEEVAECAAWMAVEHGHDLQTAQVFRLVPVPLKEIQPAFEKALAEAREEYESVYSE